MRGHKMAAVARGGNKGARERGEVPRRWLRGGQTASRRSAMRMRGHKKAAVARGGNKGAREVRV